jgi:hypothetical protein
MLDEALRRTGDSSLRVELRSGDISRLDFDDATFDGVTSERVFQHLDSPLAAAGTTGCFFWAVTIFAVGGVRHSPNGPTSAAKEEDQ